MDTQPQDNADSSQFVLTQRKLMLESRVRNGTNWFYWIGGLSVINSIVYFFGATFTFVIGLGATQFVDGFMTALAKEWGPGGEGLRLLGLGIDVCISAIFFLFGYLGRKRYPWAVILGMVLYALDGVLLLVFTDFIGAGFHVIALLGIGRSIKAINDLATLERFSPGAARSMFAPVGSSQAGQGLFSQASPSMPGDNNLSGLSSPQLTQTNQKEATSNRIMIAMVIMIVILLVVIGVLLTK